MERRMEKVSSTSQTGVITVEISSRARRWGREAFTIKTGPNFRDSGKLTTRLEKE